MRKIAALLLACLLFGGCEERHAAPVQAESSEDAAPVSSQWWEEVPEESSAGSDPEEPSQAPEEPPAEPEEPPLELEEWALVLANYDHDIREYEPELEEVQNGYRMDVRVAEIARQMIADAAEQGVSLLVCSAYRPYSSQERNFNNSVNTYLSMGYSQDQAVAATAQLIAYPGRSEHQTGLAADIVTPAYQGLDDGYAETDAAKWLLENAADYGFILRYPADKTEITRINFEPWHYRYVGIDAAKEIMENGLCLEEFLEQQGMIE